MVELTCPHCQNSSFESGLESISGFSKKLSVFRCAACGAPVSVLPEEEELGKTVVALSETVAQLFCAVERLEARLDRLLDNRTGC